MDKQKRILEMAKDICRVTHICNDVCNPISACDALKYAERAIEAGYVKQEWISVDERLPQPYKTVLIFCRNGFNTFQSVSEMLDENGRRWSAVCGIPVTHWMPLPEAPKDGDKGVKGTPNKTYYTPDEVRDMSMNEIRDNITAIRESMKRWRDE